MSGYMRLLKPSAIRKLELLECRSVYPSGELRTHYRSDFEAARLTGCLENVARAPRDTSVPTVAQWA